MKKQDKEQVKELIESNISYDTLLKLFHTKEINFLVFSQVAKVCKTPYRCRI